MNELKRKLHIIEISQEEQIQLYPTAHNLSKIPKAKQNKEMVTFVCTHDGMALEYVSKKLITLELCEIAVAQNSMSLQFVPKSYLDLNGKNDDYKKRILTLYNKAIEKDGVSIAFIPQEYISLDMSKTAIMSFKKRNGRSASYWGRYPIYYVPEKFRTHQLYVDAITYSPFCIKDINPHYEEYESLFKLAFSLNKESILGVELRFMSPAMLELYRNYKTEREALFKEHNKSLPQPKYQLLKKDDCEDVIEIQENYPSSLSKNIITIPSSHDMMIWDLSEDGFSLRDFFYISDIHIEHQIMDVLLSSGAKKRDEINKFVSDFLDNKITEMTNINHDYNSTLLIAGDVANNVNLEELFFDKLKELWKGEIISILGNHELWDGTGPSQWGNKKYTSRSIEHIVEDYKEAINSYNCHILENDIYVEYKNGINYTITEKDILDTSIEDLSEFLSECKYIILGGIGYSGLNPVYNSDMGLYRKAITSKEEDLNRSKRFLDVYNKVKLCANDKRVIVMTHTPIYDWMNEKCVKNWIYVNGHTHQNTYIRTDNTTILADNQIGYTPKNWSLNLFTLDCIYNPFSDMSDGIHIITPEQYRDFNAGYGISNVIYKLTDTIYMLKKNNIYMFLSESLYSLCLLNGGQKRKLNNSDIHYYYDNMESYCNKVKEIMSPYNNIMVQLSNEVKKFGGSGTVHGCIVDISWFSHLYVNPYDGKITPYWAINIMGRDVYKNIRLLLEEKEPELYNKYLLENHEGNLNLLAIDGNNKKSLTIKEAVMPRWVWGTEIYQPSKIMRSIQYVLQQNIIRIWNDDLLNFDNVKENKKTTKKLTKL